MTDILPAPSFNDASIEKALMEASGDLHVASQLLGHVTMMKLDRAIRRSDRLQQVYLTIEQVKALPEYDRASQERLEAEVTRRMTFYKADGLEAIHELATMNIGENSAMAQVKLAAAARLTGSMGDSGIDTDTESMLRELNKAYHEHAPRIKMTRTTTLELAPQERVIESNPAD